METEILYHKHPQRLPFYLVFVEIRRKKNRGLEMQNTRNILN